LVKITEYIWLLSNQKYLFINKNNKFDCNVIVVFELANRLIYLEFPILDSNPVKETVVFMIWGEKSLKITLR
jgi:hypothetical protein